MKIAAVICEYNPFHKGHAYHLEETRKRTGCDYIVGIMSGNFVQRGEPAILDKWARARMALSCGIDAIFELPCVYALSSAQYFAFGGVTLADGLGVDVLSFGTESPLASIQKMARLKCQPDYEQRLQRALAQGMTYPKAATAAFGEDLGKISPNDLLAVEYVAALAQIHSNIEPCAILRAYTMHDDHSIKSGFSSAKQIREMLSETVMYEYAVECVPETVKTILAQWIYDDILPGCNHFDQLVIGTIRRLGPAALNQFPFSGGGFGDLIYHCACRVTTIEELVTQCTSARYTASRIRRFLFQIIIGIDQYLCKVPAPYGRLLGFRKESSKLIGALEERSRIPIVKSVAAVRNHINQYDSQFGSVLEMDLRAQDLYSLVLKEDDHKCGMRDYTTPMVILE